MVLSFCVVAAADEPSRPLGRPSSQGPCQGQAGLVFADFAELAATSRREISSLARSRHERPGRKGRPRCPGTPPASTSAAPGPGVTRRPLIGASVRATSRASAFGGRRWVRSRLARTGRASVRNTRALAQPFVVDVNGARGVVAEHPSQVGCGYESATGQRRPCSGGRCKRTGRRSSQSSNPLPTHLRCSCSQSPRWRRSSAAGSWRTASSWVGAATADGAGPSPSAASDGASVQAASSSSTPTPLGPSIFCSPVTSMRRSCSPPARPRSTPIAVWRIPSSPSTASSWPPPP